jgi:outer membrane protein TolC
MQFNRQDDQVMIARKSDYISQNRYEVTKQRFLIGKIDVLDLNVAQSERDQAKQKYISTLGKLLAVLLPDAQVNALRLQNKQPLQADFEMLLK